MLLRCCALVGQIATAQHYKRGMAVPATSGAQRIALVIGNSAYKASPLLNPLNDARAMARALGAAGFQVISKENAGQRDMQIALRDFGDALKHGGVGLCYSAGHGIQVQGRNDLIPIDAQSEHEDEVACSRVDANHILDKMETAGNRLNIVILDACGTSPLPAASVRPGNGLVQMAAPVGTLVAFSTAPGSVASDGKGDQGLYTKHLRNAILEGRAAPQGTRRTAGLSAHEVTCPATRTARLTRLDGPALQAPLGA